MTYLSLLKNDVPVLVVRRLKARGQLGQIRRRQQPAFLDKTCIISETFGVSKIKKEQKSIEQQQE